MLEYQIVLEHFRNKGSILFSQFELIRRAQNDPIAATVLKNLVEYLRSDDHTIGTQLSGDVIFADLDSEAGLFPASLTQGIMINGHNRSEEHTSELQSLMRISYAVFCLKTNNTHKT